ncbi:MAG TPA: 4-alpha-glucanotransferase [Opitutus sp.]|nr:4-alpha-glucanotransferase [Opitutus sp.]
MATSPSSTAARAPIFNWLEGRTAGVLLHPTALPSPYGVGAFDQEAFNLLDFFAEAGIKAWQLCPLGPTGYGDSPYQCFSAFAGNPYLVDPAALVAAGLLDAGALTPLRSLDAQRVDFGALYRLKLPILFSAYEAWRRDPKRPLPYGDFAAFRRKHAHWLGAYSLFSALKEHLKGLPWWEWPAEVRTLPSAKNSALAKSVAARTEAYEFIQYLFFGQWARLRARAAELDIVIVGDTPIFAAIDSADVWANPQLFQLDRKTFRPLAVAGVPPDYFSADGQLWGNPLYDWSAHAADGYTWWFDRLRANFELYDVIRIDHFRAFDSYWSIPAGAPNARTGRWEPGPGLAFFEKLKAAIPDAKLIAEDLGELTPSVVTLREATGLPGMAILQFAFGGGADNLYLPHNQRANSVVYPGTHDNDTTLGWYAGVDEGTRDHVRRYFRVSGREIGWDFVRSAYASVCNLAVIPLQDLFTLGSEARFNKPGTSQGNWSWRYQAEQLRGLREGAAVYLRELACLYGREGKPKPRVPAAK